MKDLSVPGKIIRYMLLLFCTFIFLLPMYLAFINSLENWYSSPVFFPRVWRWQNYVDATLLIDFWRYILNSFIISGIFVTISTLSSGLVGYAFARIKAPGKNGLFMIVLSTMMIPPIVTQIPTYILYYNYKLIDTFWPWVLLGIGGSAFFIFMYRQFFLSLPVELEEAARIDGCSIFRTFWSIIFPVSIPVIATVAILLFHASWNDVSAPFMYLSQQKYPLSTALAMIGYLAGGSTQVIGQVTLAAGLILAVPVITTFFIGQRYIVQGIVTTGIKS